MEKENNNIFLVIHNRKVMSICLPCYMNHRQEKAMFNEDIEYLRHNAIYHNNQFASVLK